jgi:hypothetical protein
MTDVALVELGTLDPGEWVRLKCGDIGIIRDKVNQPGYRKASVEVPGHRYPIRIIQFVEKVQHLPLRHP